LNVIEANANNKKLIVILGKQVLGSKVGNLPPIKQEIKKENKERPLNIPKAQSVNIGGPPQGLKDLNNIQFYKNCILSTKGILFEDESIVIKTTRTNDKVVKQANIEITFTNKEGGIPIGLSKFEPITYDKCGNK